MKKTICLLLTITPSVFACGPYFPPSYLGDYDEYFIENINVPKELELIAREYHLIGPERYSSGCTSTAEAERMDFREKAAHGGGLEYMDAFERYATAVRAGDTNACPPVMPDHLKEFVLYLQGTQEFKADPGMVRPRAWDELLALDFSNRLYRTVWTHYMLGNLAGSHSMPDAASLEYDACRKAALETQKDVSLGLAHASFKRDYLAQTNLTARIRRGIAAVGYYSLSWDSARRKFCMEHLQLDMEKAESADLAAPDMAVLEAMALFNAGKEAFIARLDTCPDLKITPRLAWFMYKNGESAKAEAYLQRCPEDDVLAHWLWYRLAQRAGRTEEAIAHLKQWIDKLQYSDRVLYEFKYDAKVSSRSAVNGSLGTLYATRGQMMDALVSFVNAGAYQDAALIAERYLETGELKRYVDTLPFRAPYHDLASFQTQGEMESYEETIHLRLSYLLARRLFREGRAEEALPYYPPEIAKILNTYLDAIRKSESPWSGANTRSAHRYHAARIMRWKGMELCGAELYPDYTIINGNFPHYGIRNEARLADETKRPIYDETAPVPNERFHYRHIATELAGDAARMTWDRHQRAMMLWSAGMWIGNRSPAEADIYYKQLARIGRQPLAKTADQQRWFPAATPMMDYVHRSEDFMPPQTVSRAARDYGR